MVKYWINVFCAGLICLGCNSNLTGAESSENEPLVVEKLGPIPSEIGLMFKRHDEKAIAVRSRPNTNKLKDAESTTETEARAVIEALIAGPDSEEQAAGFTGFLPSETALGNIEFLDNDSLRISLDIPADFITTATYNEVFVHEVTEHFIESLVYLGYNEFLFSVKNPATGQYQPIRTFLPPPEKLEEPKPQYDSLELSELESREPRNLPTANGFLSGALTGKTVALNASHGWFQSGSWKIQRSRMFECLEDFASAMFINHYVIPMLQNAGARIRPVREPDSQTNLVVIDNSMGAPSYVETGSGWFNSALNGYVHKSSFVGTNDNPFGNAGATRLVTGTTINAPTATATYTATIPAAGYYNVYVSYAQGTDRTTNAHWRVHHSGGVTDFRLSQRQGGGTWILLGNFYFEQGAGQGKVVALNDSGDSNYLNVDAVRFGGGMGRMARRGSISNRPAWQEEATNYLQYTGMLATTLMSTDSTTTLNDMELGWGNRPQFANWERSRDALGNNIVYIGWHTNASGDAACSGVSPNRVDISNSVRGAHLYRDSNEDATANTKLLADKLNVAFRDSVRLSYYSSWSSNVIATDGYGESNQANLGSVPGFFFEGLYHDNDPDTRAYKDPKFRYAAARGIVQGLIEYYGGNVFPPEPVTNFRVKNIGSNQVRLEWSPGPVRTATQRFGNAATQYRIFKSSNGFGFDNGTDTGSATTVYTATLTPGQTTFYRIAAVNSAGISVPSMTLAVRVPLAGSPTVTIVNGYLRNDRFLGPIISSSGIGGCADPVASYRTMDPREFQSFDYTVQHALAIANSGGYGIDSCSRDAVKQGNVSLDSYPMVFWIAGQEAEADTGDSVDDTSLILQERVALATFLENGGKLFISGSELAWDLGRSTSSPDQRAFLQNYLKASYSLDASNTYTAAPTAGIFSGLGAFGFDNGSGSTYQVRFADVLTPGAGGTSCLSYTGGTGGTAAVQYTGTFGDSTNIGKVVYMGFGFETITNATVRNNIMNRVLTFFQDSAVDNWTSF